MICESFDQAAITNMSIALERACRDIPIELRKHDDRLFVAERIIAYAGRGNVLLGDLTAVGRQAVDELLAERNQAA